MGIKQINKVTASEKGTAILIALALIAMLSAVAIMSVDRSTTDIELSYNQLHEEQAFYAAEAGLVRAMVELNKDNSWRGPLLNEIIDDNIYAVIVLDSTWKPALKDTIIIRATGRRSGSHANLEIWLVPEKTSPFKFALFSDFWLRMTGGCVDSYNSDSGTYAETRTDSGGSIGTNGDLRLREGVSVGGDIFVGNEGTYEIDSSVTIAGDLYTDQPPLDIPPVPQSDFDEAKANNTAPAGFSGDGYTYQDDNLVIKDDDSLILSGGVYYFNSITIGAHGKLIIAPGESVIIYAGQHLEIRDYGSMNAGGKPTDLIIYAEADSRLRLDDEAEFRGAYWGPGATFRMRHSSQVFGSIYVERETVDLVDEASPCFHYDRALASYGLSSTTEGFEMVAWRQN